MDDSRFDELARRLSDGRPRRPLLGAGLTALATLGTGLAWSGEADAKKKKKKKKKKKGGKTTPPPTTKPPVTCPTGKRRCNGGCIPNENCCSSSECSAGQQCTSGVCACSGSNAITCGDKCCTGGSQICQMTQDGITTCLDGGTCPSTSVCSVTGVLLCKASASGSCLCGNTVAPAQAVCFKLEANRDCNQTCNSSADCGSGSVCIPGGPSCACAGNFCAELCNS